MAKLLKLEPRVAKRIERRALREGARPILAAARANAPRRSGLLAKSIKIRALKRSKDRIGVAVQTKEGDFQGKSFYGAAQEYGHYQGKRAGGSSHQKGESLGAGRKFIPGKHYMLRAFEQNKDQAAEIITAEIRDAIEREAKG